MKIAFFIGSFPKLSETFILNQVTGLLDKGHDVTVFAHRKPDEEKTHDIFREYNLHDRTVYSESVEYTTVANNISNFLSKSPTVFKFFKSFNPGSALQFVKNYSTFLDYGEEFDICHAHFGTVGKKWSFVPGMENQGPFITTFYGYDVSRHVHPDNYDTYNWYWPLNDMCVGITEYIRSRMIMLGCPEKLSTKIPLGIRTEKFDYSKTKFHPEDELKILTVARLVEKKGIKYALKAIANCVNKYERIKYQIAREGRLREELKNKIDRLGLQDKVSLLGWQSHEDVQNLLDTSHLFLLPSVTTRNGDTEGQALVLQEAQSKGVPVISTYHNGIPEGVKENKTGILVPERGVKEIERAIQYFLDNPGKIEKYGKAGSKHIRRNFDNNKIIKKLINLYKKVASR